MAVAVPERTWAADIALGYGVFPGSVRSREGVYTLQASLYRLHCSAGRQCGPADGITPRGSLASYDLELLSGTVLLLSAPIGPVIRNACGASHANRRVIGA
jgi:hypothetical protein